MAWSYAARCEPPLRPPPNGTAARPGRETTKGQVSETASDLAFSVRAEDGNRTRMTSLEEWPATRLPVRPKALQGGVYNGLPNGAFPSGIVAASSQNQVQMGAWEVDSAFAITQRAD